MIVLQASKEPHRKYANNIIMKQDRNSILGAGLENHGQGTWNLNKALAKEDFAYACLAHFGCIASCKRATKCIT